MTMCWLLVTEAKIDAVVASHLVDRVIIESVDWADGILPSLRRFVGFEAQAGFSTWKEVRKLADEHKVRVYGHFKGHGGATKRELEKVRALASRIGPSADAIIAVRDTDGHVERRDALSSISSDPRLPICAGTPHPELEAWLLHGFETANEIETSLLAAERRELGFDPTIEAHRLNPKREHDASGTPVKTSSKGVLDRLTQDDPARCEQCWHGVPLERARTRGTKTGMTAFLEDVEQKLVSQLTGTQADEKAPR